MKVLVTGAGGQLGRALVRTAPTNVTLTALDHNQFDIVDGHLTDNFVLSLQPEVIVNTAAYTNVDRAEVERDTARRVNTDGPRALAAAARMGNARLIHISTDFVFDGFSSTPYRPEHATNPLNVYGATKRDGELAALALLPERTVILRTAWVYSADGRNFMKTILRVLREKGLVRVVADQVGTPTSADSLAMTVWKLVGTSDLNGIHHWTDAGVASWYDFAVAIAEEAAPLKLVAPNVTVLPISTHEYETPARRPHYSVLDCRSISSHGIAQVHWRANLRAALQEIAGRMGIAGQVSASQPTRHP